MNEKQANSVKELTPEVNKVLEGLEIECSECKGKGKTTQFVNDKKGQRTEIDTCPKCKGTGKVKWRWQPKAGEWYISPEDIVFLVPSFQGMSEAHQNLCTPILEWEEIEGIVKKAGYVSVIHKHEDGYHAGFYIRERVTGEEFGKTRQEAVMLAVIKLGKELKK